MLTDRFSVNEKILVLRLSRLGRLPPALYCSEILVEKDFPVLALEYGYIQEPQSQVEAKVPRLRMASRWAALIPAPLRPLSIFVSMVFRLSWLFLTKGRPKLILAEGCQEYSLAVFLHLLLRIPYACHVHEIYDNWEMRGANRLFLHWERAAFRRAQFLIFPEENRARIYRCRYRFDSRVYVVFNCPRLQEKLANPLDLRQKLGLPKSSVLMAYLGGIGTDNALEEGISSLAQLPEVFFLIWGWGDKEYVRTLKELARQKGVENRVLFLGELDTMKLEHLEGCDMSYCFYRPSNLRRQFQASASNKLMESIAVGVPVITTEERDFVDLVKKYDVGICAREISTPAITQAVKELLASPVALKRKSANGRKLHLESFNYESQFESVLEEFHLLYPRESRRKVA